MTASLHTRYLAAHKQVLRVLETDLPGLSKHSRTGQTSKKALEALVRCMEEVGQGLEVAIETEEQVDPDEGFRLAKEVLAMFR